MANHTLKILRCEQCNIFKVCQLFFKRWTVSQCLLKVSNRDTNQHSRREFKCLNCWFWTVYFWKYFVWSFRIFRLPAVLLYLANIYLFKVDNRNTTRKRCEIYLKVTIKTFLLSNFTPFSIIYIVDFEQVNVSWIFSCLFSPYFCI